MANKIQFKRGLKSKLPSSAPSGMPLWCTDTKELYIGTETGIEKVGGLDSDYTPETYTKDEIDYMFNLIPQIPDTYTRYEIDTLFNNLPDTYTRGEIDNLFNDIENLLREV